MSAPAPLFLGDHPALDFLNTAFFTLPERVPVELIEDGPALLDWLRQADLLESRVATKLARRFGRAALDDVAADARKFRLFASEWLERWRRAPDADHGADLQRLNRALERADGYPELIQEDGAIRLREVPRFEDPGELLAIVALQVAGLVTTERAELVRRCAGDGCVLWFVDRTKAHRRLFCSAAACGNRAKVAAFRARQRDR